MRERRAQPKSTTAATRKRFPASAVVVLVVATVTALGLWLNRSQPDATPKKGAAETNILNAPAAAPTADPAFQKLQGRWLRPDGGYVIEIKSAGEDGRLDAAYFNPKPIHVARAVAAREGSAVKVFIELRDVNYPGSTYRLFHDPASDQLKGVYYQALLQQSFEVFFERLK
jgi:hypothetical protein